MAKIQIPKKLRAEDFASADQSLINKLAYPINSFMDDIYYSYQKGLDFDNLNRQVVNIPVTIDGSGNVTNPPQVAHTLKTKPQGAVVIRAQCTSNGALFPLAAPFVSYTVVSSSKILLLAVTGLQSGSQYILTIELIG